MTHGLLVRKRDSTSSSSPDLAASDLSVYVAKYVRDMLEMKEKREALVKHLSGHQPFVETEFMAVAMIDISGFSALTSLFSEMLGKLSSEVISAGTGEYIEKIAPIVLGYGGDIVKFLGDALLVTFSSTEPDEDRNSIIRRAVLCCTDVLLEHPSHPIDVKRWANAMSSSTTSPKKHEPAHLSYSATRRLKRSEDLTLHAGITCGMVSRVIVGIPSLRLDYFVAGDCLKELGALLDEAKSGQLGLSTEVTKIFGSLPSIQIDSHRRILYREHLETLRIEDAPLDGRNRKGSIAASTASSNPYHMDVDTSLIPFFINQSVLLRIRASSIAPAPSPIPQLLTRRVTDFKSEYRTLSVLFVKPLSEFDVQKAQIYTEEFLKSLKANNGVFHQCSVDDKGQTFLACFGLPPFANETGCRNAIKTSIDFQAALKHRAPGSRFSMAIATGNIFFGTLGTRGRKEAGLLGDVFNLAVRLLSIKREHQLVAIDKPTRDAVKKDFVCVELGKHKVKGKDQEVEVWGIPSDGHASRSRLKREFNDPMGNLEELDSLKRSFNEWQGGKKMKYVVLVEGPSGMGKSNMLKFFEKHVVESGRDHCIARGTEMGQTIPYSAMHILLPKLLSLVPTLPNPSRSSSRTTMSESPMIRSETRRSFDFLQDTRIRTLLIEVGEDPSYADLFSENSGGVPRRGSLVVTKPGGSVMQFQSATGTPKGKFALDAEGRRTILKALVTKIVAHVIGTRRVVMILDDAQWLDVASVDIVLAVVERCKNLCIVAFSRPLGNEHKIKSIPFDQKFTLAGLRYCEVEKCLLERLHGVKITPKLVQSVLEHSGGNLLQVDTLVTFLMDETEEHALDDEAIQNILSTRIETLIMTQFDRLDPFLQTVFKFSSILGHYFSISDLLLLLADPALTPSLLTKAIHAGDRFQFMIIEPSEIHFRHITIAKVIYESIPMADRQRLHEMVGEYYEGLAGEEGDERKMWMGVMCFHFWRSGNVEKKVARYVELGFTYFLDALPFETTTIFKELLQFLDDNDADVGKGRELIEVAMKADIIARLAWSSVNFVPHADTRRYAVRALEMSGVEWPKDLASVKTGILEAVKRIGILWMKSRGGMKDVEKRRKVSKRSVDVTSQPSNSFARLLAASSPYFNSTPIQETPQDRRYATIKFSLLALNTLTIMDSEMDGELKFFIILQNLIHAFQRCHSDPDNMLFGLTLSAYTMARFGEWGYWVARQLYNVTCRMRHKCTDAIVPNFRIYAALTLSFDRSPKMALGMYLENERFWDERKVARECYKLKPLMFGASVLAGKLRMMTEGTPDALVREMMVTERMWTVGVCSVLMFEAMYAGDVERVERFGGMAGVVAEGFGDQIRYVFGYINGMMEVLVHLAKGEGYEKEFCERMEIYADNSSKLQMEENQVYMIFHSFVLLMGCTAIMNRVLKGRGGGALSISTTALQQSIAQVLKRVPVVRASFQLVIARHVYTACGRVLEGKGYKEAGWFKAMFCRKPYAGQMDEGGEFMGLGGFVAGAVGHLSQNEVERRRFAMRAAGLFRGMQAAACERWALMALQ